MSEDLRKHVMDKRVLFVTGAGISTGAGLPDYISDPDYTGPKLTDVIACWFDSDRFHNLISHNLPILQGLAVVQPTAAHKAIDTFLASSKGSYLFTQNVDGLHGEGRRVVEAHGSLLRSRSLITHKVCRIPRTAFQRLTRKLATQPRLRMLELLTELLRVYRGGLPDVVLMNQPVRIPARAIEIAPDNFDTLFLIGTSGRITWVQKLVTGFVTKGKAVLSCADQSHLPAGVRHLRGDIQRTVPYFCQVS